MRKQNQKALEIKNEREDRFNTFWRILDGYDFRDLAKFQNFS